MSFFSVDFAFNISFDFVPKIIFQMDSAGIKIILMGPKDETGMPIAINQALVDSKDKDPAHRMLMNFNTDGTLSQISNPTMGFMNFTYVNDTAIVVKLTLPDTLGSYQVTYNPKNQKKYTAGCNCPKNQNPISGPKREDGVFTYTMPDNPAPPPPSGFSAKVQYLLNALCWGNIPKGLSVNGICGMLQSESPTLGTMVCETMLTAYLMICRASTAKKVTQDVFDLYTSANVTISITAQSSVLSSQTKKIEFIPSGGTLPDVQFSFSGAASFLMVYTVPEAPVAKQGYNIVAILNQSGASGTVTVRLSMVGSDGYTKAMDFEVAPGGNCQLDIPGGAKGVRDDITAQIMTGSTPLVGELVKLHLIFQ